MAKGLQNRKKQNTAAFLQYTILFCILVAGIYGVLIINHKTFLQPGDGITQGYFWTTELKHQMEMLFAGEGLQRWSWSRLLGTTVQSYRYWDPFNWIAAAFPVGYIELGYTVAALLRIYCGGAAFLALMRYTGLGVFAGVLGAAAYAFSGYNIAAGLQNADLLINIYLFPLLILSVEMIYRDRTPAFFSLVTALYIASSIYYAYMAAISVVLYILLRYFAYREFGLKDYAKNAGRFAFYGTVGICIGGVRFIPGVLTLSGASTESATDMSGLLFGRNYYVHFGEKLLGTGDIKYYYIMGWTLIVIMLLAAALLRLRLKNTPVLMTLILLAGAMTPAVCSMYNGFGYPSLRWIFVLEVFAAWAAAEMLDKKELLSRQGVTAAAAALAVMAFLTLGVNYLSGTWTGGRADAFMAIQLAGGAAFMLLLISAKKEGRLTRTGKVMAVAILACTLSAAWTVSFIDGKGELYRNNEINKMLQESTQRAGALIEDDGFYRIDQVDFILFRHRMQVPPNETLWWQTRSIYEYNSRIPSDLLEFNRLTGNSYGYSRRVVVLSNDNRTGLDYLYGVKYYLGDDLKNGKAGSDKYAGYGFEECATLDGVRVFRSKYDVSLGYVFDKWMSESEFEKLNYAEREQALLQAAVLPDDAEISSAKMVTAGDIKTSVKDVDYAVTEQDGAAFGDGSIVVDRAGGSITLEPEDIENSQLLLSMTGLLRNVSEGQSQPFALRVENEQAVEFAYNRRSNQTIANIRDYDLNLGYYDHYSGGKIKIIFSSPGTYSYESIKLLAMDADLFDECIGKLSDRKYEIESFSDTLVEGTVDSESGGLLFLSIIQPEVWDCYLDGEKAEIIKNTDIAFTGVEVPAGHHSVTLKFNDRTAKKGAMMSVAGLIILAAACLVRRRKKKEEKRS